MAQRWAVSLPPALCLLALAAMGTAFGFLGVVLATSVVVAAIAVVKSLTDTARCGRTVVKP
jgi:predicted PurR-regulated permease PerM